MRIESNQYSLGFVTQLMYMHLCGGFVTLAVDLCVCVIFLSAHVVIETHTHPICILFQQGYSKFMVPAA